MKRAWNLPSYQVVSGEIYILSCSKKFPWGTPFAECSKLSGSAARQQGNAGRQNLVCWFGRSRVLIGHRFQKISKRKIFYHPTVWHVFLAQKWPALINSLWENGCRQRKAVFRYETSMKFAIISGGFGRDLYFELIKKFPWGTPFAEFLKLWGSAAREKGSAGRQNLVCWFRRSRVLICHRFQKISKRKNFYHPARSEEHTSELQSHSDLVCRLLLEKKKNTYDNT